MNIELLEKYKKIELHPDDFDRYLPDLWEKTDDVRKSAEQYLSQCEENLVSLIFEQYNSEHVLGIRSKMVDRLMIHLFNHFQNEALKVAPTTKEKATLIAVGGYGRREMNLNSDIDLLFLYSRKKGAYIEVLTEKMLYLLWDLKLDVGYSTRTINDCKKLFLDDVTVMTALLDCRYLCGDQEQLTQLNDSLDGILKSKSIQKKLVKYKVLERKDVIKKYGESVFVLEPNVKENAGGLRDLHTPLWIAKLLLLPASYESFFNQNYINREELKLLLAARNFLWRLRNEIHLISGKKTDQLTFHYQEKVAQRMGFKNDDSGILGVERFMQTYYRLGFQVHEITDRLVRTLTKSRDPIGKILSLVKARVVNENFKIIDGHIVANSKEVFERNPVSMMEIFQLVQIEGLPIHSETKDFIRSLVHLVDDSFRSNEKIINMFHSILNQYKNLGNVLLAMHEVHFLDEWMPEFKKLRCRVQHDAYHIYTIDTHSIFAVNELSKLDSGVYDDQFPFYKKILSEIQKPELLTLGLFLHDIGKGEGGNHHIKGTQIADTLLKRLEYSMKDQKTIKFLILSHLMMPHLSQRRDLQDPDLINHFSRSMTSLENLNMLFLLTWGDIRAVGPEAWTDWKGKLLEVLYSRTKQVLTNGEYSKEKTSERIAKVKNMVKSQLQGEFSDKDVDLFLNNMLPRYFFGVTDKDYKKHLEIYKKAQLEQVVVDFVKPEGLSYTEMILYTINTPRVLSEVTGLMLIYTMNVIRVDVFQTRDGNLLVLVRLTDRWGKEIKGPDVFEQMSRDLKGILSGKEDVSKLISKTKLPTYLQKKAVQKAKSKVHIDNDVSVNYTVIDVYAHDRLGLLYDISKVLENQGCFVKVSKISTKVEQVADIFYVTDIFGKKIIPKEKLDKIKESLMRVI